MNPCPFKSARWQTEVSGSREQSDSKGQWRVEKRPAMGDWHTYCIIECRPT